MRPLSAIPLALMMMAGSVRLLSCLLRRTSRTYSIVVKSNGLCSVFADEELLHCLVPRLGVHAEDVGRIDGQRAVHIDREGREYRRLRPVG